MNLYIEDFVNYKKEELEEYVYMLKCDEKPVVAIRDGMSYNAEYCINHNIPVVESNHAGGCIVLSPGVCILIINSFEREYYNIIMEETKKFLESKNIPYEQDNNDILVDGKKVSGASYAIERDNIYTASFINYTVDLELIRNICTKPMVKEPGGLEKYGVTKEELRDLYYKIARSIEEGLYE